MTKTEPVVGQVAPEGFLGRLGRFNLWSFPTKPSFRNDIQGLRAIAVVYTVLFDLKGFYARRVRRILPVSTLVLVVTIIAAYIWLGPLGGDTQVASDA
jgi:peptidoglycan/LPS O-acetylase OafA/YrhL